VFDLQPGLRSASRSGEFILPELSELETSRPPRLLLFFDTDGDLDLTLNYINFYFA
jgi:hypothetical protein